MGAWYRGCASVLHTEEAGSTPAAPTKRARRRTLASLLISRSRFESGRVHALAEHTGVSLGLISRSAQGSSPSSATKLLTFVVRSGYSERA